MLRLIGRGDRRDPPREHRSAGGVFQILRDFSIEVTPKTAAGVADFRALLPPETHVYIAHIDGTPIEAMVATARRLSDQGMRPLPHLPARSIPSRAALADWLARYRDEAGVDRALLLAGGRGTPAGPFESSMQLLETGLLDAHGFRRLHVAGHPEGNRDIDPAGGTRAVDDAVRWKQAFAERTGAEMAVVTQFAFDAAPVLAWIDRLRAEGIGLPVHVGVAGPAKLQTLIRYGLSCGVGASMQVLQKRARDATRLARPYEPTEVLADLASAEAARPGRVERIHFFPLGGLAACAEYARRRSGGPVALAI